jgi:hypothetical protein
LGLVEPCGSVVSRQNDDEDQEKKQMSHLQAALVELDKQVAEDLAAAQVAAAKYKATAALTARIRQALTADAATPVAEAPKRRGRKPGSKNAPKTKVKAKAAPKKTAAVAKAKKATKAPKKVSKAAAGAAAEGRRAVARGDRPPLKEAMAIVSMGKGEVTAGMIVKGLEAKGWLPNAGKPQSYISYMLSSNTFDEKKRPDGIFVNVSRGVYKVVDGFKPSGKLGRKSKGAAPKAAVAAKAPATKGRKGSKKAPEANGGSLPPDQVNKNLADLGLESGAVASNPFST